MAPKKQPYSELSQSGKHYRDNKKSRDKKKNYDTEFGKSKEQRSKRSELSKKNREADKRGVNRDGKDFDHAVGRYVSVKTNRGRKEKSRLKK